MRPLVIYQSADGYYVAAQVTEDDAEAMLADRVSEFFDSEQAAEEERLRLIDEFQRTGVYPPRVTS